MLFRTASGRRAVPRGTAGHTQSKAGTFQGLTQGWSSSGATEGSGRSSDQSDPCTCKRGAPPAVLSPPKWLDGPVLALSVRNLFAFARWCPPGCGTAGRHSFCSRSSFWRAARRSRMARLALTSPASRERRVILLIQRSYRLLWTRRRSAARAPSSRKLSTHAFKTARLTSKAGHCGRPTPLSEAHATFPGTDTRSRRAASRDPSLRASKAKRALWSVTGHADPRQSPLAVR